MNLTIRSLDYQQALLLSAHLIFLCSPRYLFFYYSLSIFLTAHSCVIRKRSSSSYKNGTTHTANPHAHFQTCRNPLRLNSVHGRAKVSEYVAIIAELESRPLPIIQPTVSETSTLSLDLPRDANTGCCSAYICFYYFTIDYFDIYSFS